MYLSRLNIKSRHEFESGNNKILCWQWMLLSYGSKIRKFTYCSHTVHVTQSSYCKAKEIPLSCFQSLLDIVVGTVPGQIFYVPP